MHRRRFHTAVLGACATTAWLAPVAVPFSLFAAEPADGLTIVVMDPLAAPLSCPCVEGYAQRKYEVLAAHLEGVLGRPVGVVFAESLNKALAGEAAGRAHLIIGKDSVVRADAATAKLAIEPVGRLTDKSGSTTQHGLIVVAAKDPAQQVSDLADYQILFGPAECDEKHAAPMALLREAGIKLPAKPAIDGSCSDSAAKVVEAGPTARTAAVISSYAAPLLEGCGTIKKGDLRVVGKTADLPFITAFATEQLSAGERAKLVPALQALAAHREVCEAIESLIGFVPADDGKKK